MNKIEFPKQLRVLLDDSDLQAPLRLFADRVGEILADNKLYFFPDYTDHGSEHINAVLRTQVELVPRAVWDNSTRDSDPRLLTDADAAVIIAATCLHDIGMHLRPDGFCELVAESSRFKPLPWFMENHEGHSADRPWRDLWDDYVREARRFSDRDLTNIVGEISARSWKFTGLPSDAGQWQRNHCLVIGEFIRRHHARLAHEIAIYGFPGLPVGTGEGQFPAMGKEQGHPLMRLADIVGLTARSHGISLRLCKSYLDASSLYPGTPRPMGTAVLFPMALLRVADYLQIDKQRAPAALLQLRNPQSPISVQEWKKHRAVQHVGPATDLRGKMVTVSNDLSLPTYLQLRELLDGLQSEMDHSTAVLDEFYGTLTDLGLNQLNLAVRRVYSNLQSPAFRDSLPYVPNRTGFAADPNLLTLLVEPLYGRNPGVGVRELMQNGVDAVCELQAWCDIHKTELESLDLPDQRCDVLMEFIRHGEGAWRLRVCDRGIGMKSDTIQSYFLRAGASFRRSVEWTKEFVDEKGNPRVIRSGRFGIGAFALFLLGSTFRMSTRHVASDRSNGYFIEASVNSQLIEIRRVGDLPIGTTIEVDLSDDAIKSFELESNSPNHKSYVVESMTDWYCGSWPVVERRVIKDPVSNLLLQQRYRFPLRKEAESPAWSVIYPVGFDAVSWTFDDAPSITCNGIRIARPEKWNFAGAGFAWESGSGFERPSIAVLDSVASLPLTAQRYALSQDSLPFNGELIRDVTLSFFAYALVCGPKSCLDLLEGGKKFPLLLSQVAKYRGIPSELDIWASGSFRWCATPSGFVPADPWLFSLLNVNRMIVWGGVWVENPGVFDFSAGKEKLAAILREGAYAIVSWHGSSRGAGFETNWNRKKLGVGVATTMRRLVCDGVSALGFKPLAAEVVISAAKDLMFAESTRALHVHRQEIGAPLPAWEQIPCKGPANRFRGGAGVTRWSTSLVDFLDGLEDSIGGVNGDGSNWKKSNPEAFFAGKLESMRTPKSPESPLAKVWLECLGSKLIPFDVEARKAMVELAREHAELGRHIRSWQELSGKESKWA